MGAYLQGLRPHPLHMCITLFGRRNGHPNYCDAFATADNLFKSNFGLHVITRYSLSMADTNKLTAGFYSAYIVRGTSVAVHGGSRHAHMGGGH